LAGRLKSKKAFHIINWIDKGISGDKTTNHVTLLCISLVYSLKGSRGSITGSAGLAEKNGNQLVPVTLIALISVA